MQNFLYCHLCPLALITIHLQEDSGFFLYIHPTVFSWYACTWACVIFVTVCCIHTSMSMSCAGQPKPALQKQSRKCQRGTTTPLLDLLVTSGKYNAGWGWPCLPQLPTHAQCVHEEPGSPSAKLLSSQLSSSMCRYRGLFHAHHRTSHLSLLSLVKVLVTRSSSLSWSLWITALPSSPSTTPLQAGIIHKFADGALSLIVQIINTGDTEQHWPQNLSLQGIAASNRMSDGLSTANHNLFSLVVQSIFHPFNHPYQDYPVHISLFWLVGYYQRPWEKLSKQYSLLFPCP